MVPAFGVATLVPVLFLTAVPALAQAPTSVLSPVGSGPGGLGVPELSASCGAWQVVVVAKAKFGAPAKSFSATATLSPTASPAGGGDIAAQVTHFSTGSQSYAGTPVSGWAFDIPVTAQGPVQPGPYTMTVHWSVGGSSFTARSFTQVEPQATSQLGRPAQCALSHSVSTSVNVGGGLQVLSTIFKSVHAACPICAGTAGTVANLGVLLAADAGMTRYLTDITPDFNYKAVATPGRAGAPPVVASSGVPSSFNRAASALRSGLSRQFQLEDALVVSFAREWGAGLAGSAYWSAKQAQAVQRYAIELSGLVLADGPQVRALAKAVPSKFLGYRTNAATAQKYAQQAAAWSLTPAESAVLGHLGASQVVTQQVLAVAAEETASQLTGKDLAQLLGTPLLSALSSQQSVFQDLVSSQGQSGLWLATSNGSIFNLGAAKQYGPFAKPAFASPLAAVAASPDGQGYWLVTKGGGVHAYGTAKPHGPAAGRHLSAPVVAMVATLDGKGYWLATSKGQVYAFGDAKTYGAERLASLAKPVVAMAATSDGQGYWLVSTDGHVLDFGDAQRFGPTPRDLSAPVVAIAATSRGQGYWLATSAGQVLRFGDAAFYGPTTKNRPVGRVVSMVASRDGLGYWLVTGKGRVANFGDAGTLRMSGKAVPARPVVGVAATTAAGPGAFGAGVFNYVLPGVVPDAGHAVGGLLEADGRTWVAEPSSSAIAAISRDGSVQQYPTPTLNSHPLSLAVGTGGDIWFTEQNSNKIGLIEPSGQIVEYTVPIKGTQLSGIAVGPDGRAWFVELESDSIAAITRGGTITTYALPVAGSGPRDITRGPDGRMWFVQDAASSVGAISMGGEVTEYPVPTADSHPRHIVAGPDGRLWFTEFGGDKVGAISTAGKVTEYPVPTPAAGPNGITVGPDGHVWFTESGAGKIGTVDLATGKATDYPLLGNASEPLDIAGGPNGTLLISDNLNMSVDVLTITQLERLAPVTKG